MPILQIPIKSLKPEKKSNVGLPGVLPLVINVLTLWIVPHKTHCLCMLWLEKLSLPGFTFFLQLVFQWLLVVFLCVQGHYAHGDSGHLGYLLKPLFTWPFLRRQMWLVRQPRRTQGSQSEAEWWLRAHECYQGMLAAIGDFALLCIILPFLPHCHCIIVHDCCKDYCFVLLLLICWLIGTANNCVPA